ncbi:MAG: phage holin family protein [Verrucomicrobia bacterium]|nr:phage holin family protein [Verrucomicrobiota bacterium]
MEDLVTNFVQMAASSKQFARRLFASGENRLELLLVEVQEERERLLRALVMVLCIAGFTLLAVMALSGAIIVLLWHFSPVGAFMALTALYSACGLYFYRRLTLLQRNWKTLSATLDQLKKDRECLEKSLE